MFNVMNVDMIVLFVLFQGNHHSTTKFYCYYNLSINCNIEMNRLNRTVLKIDSTLRYNFALHVRTYAINVVLYHAKFIHSM